jgi:ribonuclease HI
MWEAMREIWPIPRIVAPIQDDWLEAWLLGVPLEICGRILMIAWRVWYARNEVTHDKILPAIEGSRRFICSYIQNLDNIGRLTHEEIVKGKRATSQPVEAKLQQQPSTAVAWSRPPNGTVKLNIDGAYIAQTGSAGAGMILRRDDGSIIFSACRSLKFCSSALESELQACLEGVRLALDGCTNDIIVETDNLELSLMAKSAARDASTLSHLMEDLRLLIKSERIIAFNKIPRGQNSASHELARFGMFQNRTEVWLDAAPESLMSRILRDCNHTVTI